MENKYTHHSRYFCGHEISPYGLENGYIDYRTLAKAFDAVLCNDIIPQTNGVVGWWELENGDEFYYYNDEGDEISRDEYDENGGHCDNVDIYQFYIITYGGAEILKDYTNEIVWYNEKLDLYVWGVTHYGTAWDYVLTDIPVELEGGANHE